MWYVGLLALVVLVSYILIRARARRSSNQYTVVEVERISR